jgi:hypothetical protein
MPRWGLVTLIALVLVGCAQKGPPRPVIRTVGVISAIGDTFHHERISRNSTGGDSKTSSLQGWDIDEYVVAQAGALLGRKYQVRPVAHARGAFAPDKIHFPDEKSPGTRRRPIEEVVRREAKPQGLDAYVVLTRGFVPVAGTQQVARGLGLAKAEGGMAENRAYLHAVYWVTVVNGRNFRIIGDAKAPVLNGLPQAGDAAGETALIGAPSVPTDSTFAADSLTALSSERRHRLRVALQKLIADSLPDALQAAKLLD